VSIIRRILKRDDAGGKLSLFSQQLDTAIDTFHVCFMLWTLHVSHPSQITENMRTEDALNQLLEVIREGEKKRDILLMNSPFFSPPESLINTDL